MPKNIQTTEEAYGEHDMLIRNTLIDNMDEFTELEKLRDDLATEEAQALQEWRKANQPRFERLAELEEKEIGWHKALNEYVESMVIETDRRHFFDRAITATKRKRPGEYSYGELFAWVRERRFMDLFVIPKEPDERLLKQLQKAAEESFDLIDEGKPAPDIYLELDEKAAAKFATQVDKQGRRLFPKAPVPLEEYVAQVSIAMFRKLMNQFRIEHEVDERENG